MGSKRQPREGRKLEPGWTLTGNADACRAAQIATLASPELLLFAERRCSASSAFGGSSRHVNPASLYGVADYAMAYDPKSNTVAVTDRAGFLTI